MNADKGPSRATGRRPVRRRAALERIAAEGAPKAIGPYTQAIASGDLVFCSGQIALDPNSGELIGGTVREQTQRVLENLSAVLQAAGTDLQHVLKTTVFLTDLTDFSEMNAVYSEAFGGHAPARATVQVAGLPRGGRVEIECVATLVK